jgi:ubiquinone/menaquinone biosynthesis C-methylase UbiE
MKNAAYDKFLANKFDNIAPHYDNYHHGHHDFISLLNAQIELNEAQPIHKSELVIAEIGCGTGNETLNIYNKFECKVIGIDLSENMLKKARQKTDEINWLKGHAESIPLKNNFVDIITSFFSVHHFSNIDKAISEFHRILKNDGMVFLVIISHEQMRNSLEYKFFPELLEYDIRRVPSIELIESVFVKNGFLVKVNTLLYESRKIDADYLRMVESRYRTGLNFLSDQQIQQGISRIENAILRNKHLVDSIMCSVLICRKNL